MGVGNHFLPSRDLSIGFLLPPSRPHLLKENLRMLLRHLKESECGSIWFPLALFPSPDGLRADVQSRCKDRLGKGHLTSDFLDPI